MRKSLLLLTVPALLAVGCRPSGDRADAQETGAVAGSGRVSSGDVGDPVKPGAEQVTPETLPANLAIAEPQPSAASNSAAPMDAGNHQDPAPALTIPAQYRGRWGMVPADCTSTRGDAKGLISIGERAIKFFEATATLSEQRPAIATSFSGRFSFTGEGQTWQKVQTLTRTGETLNRAEEEGQFNYTRCRA